jgi:hypothetical protein
MKPYLSAWHEREGVSLELRLGQGAGKEGNTGGSAILRCLPSYYSVHCRKPLQYANAQRRINPLTHGLFEVR